MSKNCPEFRQISGDPCPSVKPLHDRLCSDYHAVGARIDRVTTPVRAFQSEFNDGLSADACNARATRYKAENGDEIQKSAETG